LEETLKILALLKDLKPEILDRILEYEKWKVQATLDHEYRLVELKTGKRPPVEAGIIGPSQDDVAVEISEDDLIFNKISSFGKCTRDQVNKISRTNIVTAAKGKVQEIFPSWTEEFILSTEYKSIKGKADKQKTYKDILTLLLWSSCCLARAARWPKSRDINKLDSIKDSIRDCAGSFDAQVLAATVAFTIRTWDVYIFTGSDQIPPDVSLIEEVTGAIILSDPPDIMDSPLFIAFASEFPHITADNLKRLKTMYELNSADFVTVAMRFLTMDFEVNPPPDVNLDPDCPWRDFWRETFAVDYKEKWKNKVKAIEETTKSEQGAWSQGLTSSQTQNLS
jgi:hypothetical protein